MKYLKLLLIGCITAISRMFMVICLIPFVLACIGVILIYGHRRFGITLIFAGAKMLGINKQLNQFMAEYDHSKDLK